MSPDLVTVGGWLFSVVTAFIAYKAATRAHRETTRDSDKNVYVTAVTNERAKWREELRRSVSEFSKECIQPSPSLPELLRLKTDIILRLNPRAREESMRQKHKFDRQIIDAVNAQYESLSGSKPEEIHHHLASLELGAQELLKQEWEKSKAEAVAGQGRTPPSPKSDASQETPLRGT